MNPLLPPGSEGHRVAGLSAIPRLRPRPADALLPSVSLADLAEVVWRRLWSIVLIVILTIALTLGYIQLIRGDVYMAEAKLLVRIGQEQAPPPTMIDRSAVIGTPTGFVTAEMEMLRSRDLIGALVDRLDLSDKPRPPATSLLGLVKNYAKDIWGKVKDAIDEVLILAGMKPRLTPRELAVEAISRSILVESPPNSSIFSVRMIWPDRGAPNLMLGMLLDMYLSHRATLFQGTPATNFFRDRRQETAERLREAEQALGDFEREHGIANPDEQRSALLRRLSDADTGVDAARLDVQLTTTALEQLRAAERAGQDELATFAVAQYGGGLQQTLASELATTASRLLAAQTTLSAQDANIRRLQASMLALSRALTQQLTATAEQRQAQLVLREAQREAIRADLQTLQGAIARWQELRRDVGSAMRAYEFNDGKLNEAIGIAALESARLGNVVVVQSASEHAAPVGIRKSTMLALAAGGGVMLALTWVVLSEFFDHRLKTPGDVERRLSLRLLATIPLDTRRFGANAGRSRGGRRRTGRQDQLDRAADVEFARTAAALGRYASQEGMRVLMVTAGADGEGASTICTQVGRHLSGLLGLRVLLVDLGGQRPGLREYAARLPSPPVRFEPQGAGAQALATGGLAIADLATNGPTGVFPTLDGILAAAAGRFDLVLIDAPPWQSGPEALLALRACSHVMVVAAANSLSWEPLERMCADLEEERVELIGCVLNRYRRSLPHWLHEVLR